MLRGSARVEWGPEQQKAFEDLKLYLQWLSILSSPEQGQPLKLYVSTMHSVVSGALVIEKEISQMGKISKQQYPIYFISEVLVRSKKYYSKVEKICYAVVMSARKLRYYFEAHTIRVLTNLPLSDIFGSMDSSGRISKWAIQLSEYIVDFEKCNAIKSQILADFVTECTEPSSQTEDVVRESPWLVYYDKAWGSAGAATVLISPSRIKLHYAARLLFTNEADKCTNNIT
jgi:hypothetical protein